MHTTSILSRALALLVLLLANMPQVRAQRLSPQAAGQAHNRALEALRMQWQQATEPAQLAAPVVEWARTALPSQPSLAPSVAEAYLAFAASLEAPGSLSTQLERLPLSAEQRLRLLQLFALPDDLPLPQLLAQLNQLAAGPHLATEDNSLSGAEIVDRVAAIGAASAIFWDAEERPSSEPKVDSLRKVRRSRLWKADAGGFLKGLLFGLFYYGSARTFGQLSNGPAMLVASAFVVVFPVLESIQYAIKLRTGRVKLEDDPWWGPPQPVRQFQRRPGGNTLTPHGNQPQPNDNRP